MARYAVDIIDTYKNTLIVDGVDNIDEAIEVVKGMEVKTEYDDTTYIANKEFCEDGEPGKVNNNDSYGLYDHVADCIMSGEVVCWMIDIGIKKTRTGYYAFTYKDIAEKFNITIQCIEDNILDLLELIRYWHDEVDDWCFGKNKIVLHFNEQYCPNIERKVDDNE